MNTKKLYRLITILSMLGIVLAIYLFWQQLNTPAFIPCNVNNFINCDAVITGEVALTFGLPTPLYGLVGYIIIFFASLFRKQKILLGTAAFGLVFCLRLAYIELFQLHVICPVCIICQLLMIIIFISAIFLYKKKG